MNKKNLLLLAAAGFFLLAPVAHLQLAAGDNIIMMGQEKVISDSDLTAAIKKVLVMNPDFSSYKIDVSVHKGAVILSGKVPNEITKINIESAVKGIVGVNSVTNNIIVGS